MTFAECQYHSAQRQRTARAREEDPEVQYTVTIRRDPLPEPDLFDLYEEPGGLRPHLLLEPQGAQAQVARHQVAQILDVRVFLELPLIEYVDRIQQRPDDHAVDIPFSQVVVEPSEVHVPQVIPQERILVRFGWSVPQVTPQMRTSERFEVHIVEVQGLQGIP